MDYVVYGTGYGATLMLLGYAVRTWGPGWRFRPDEEGAYDRREFRSARSSWMRFTTGLGAVIATAGAVLVLTTFLLMLLNPGDDTGRTVALVVTGLMLVGVAVWSWFFHDRFGSWGVVASPDALSSYEPMRYDNASETTPTPASEPAAEEDVPFHEDDEEEFDEEYEPQDDDDEFAARYSKFEVHHPDVEPEHDESDVQRAEEVEADAADVLDDDRYEAQYGKYMSHHPDEDGEGDEVAPATTSDGEIEEIEEFVETLTPEEVTEDLIDYADDEPIEDGPIDADAENADDEEIVRVEPVENAGQDDPLEVVPEAQDELEPLLASDVSDDEDEGPGGREEALKRLRERQAQQRAERPNDDA